MLTLPEETLKSLRCIFAKYSQSFCGHCGCADICKNRKSLNILKAAFMIRELELIQDNEYLFESKLSLYKPIIKLLCQC